MPAHLPTAIKWLKYTFFGAWEKVSSIKRVCKSIAFYMTICVLIISLNYQPILVTQLFELLFLKQVLPIFHNSSWMDIIFLSFGERDYHDHFTIPQSHGDVSMVNTSPVCSGWGFSTVLQANYTGWSSAYIYLLLFKKVQPQSSWATILKEENFFYPGNLLQEQSGC